MGGTSMAVAKRWAKDSFYTETVFRGTALDIGAAGDPLSRYRAELPHLTRITGLDHDKSPDGLVDSELIQAGADQIPTGLTWDLVYSSHCLEHLYQHTLQRVADAWWAAVRPGGHLLVIVPDMEMYERGHWPSKYNCDHKTTWRLERLPADPYYVESLRQFVMLPGSELLSIQRLSAGYVDGARDQTATGECESGIEAVVRKKGGDVNGLSTLV
jgi:SAM-dependent methyltransferase